MPILKYMWLKVTYETYKRHDVKRNKTEENSFTYLQEKTQILYRLGSI